VQPAQLHSQKQNPLWQESRSIRLRGLDLIWAVESRIGRDSLQWDWVDQGVCDYVLFHSLAGDQAGVEEVEGMIG